MTVTVLSTGYELRYAGGPNNMRVRLYVQTQQHATSIGGTLSLSQDMEPTLSTRARDVLGSGC